MDSNVLIVIIQFMLVIITMISVVVLYNTIKSNKNLNQRLLFNELVKQERELRIKLNEYREEIYRKPDKSRKSIELTLDYDTLLFNYYEYLAICLHQNLVNEKESKFYFRDLLIAVKQRFEDSILFKESYAEESQYKSLLWLFNKWRV